MTAMTPRPQRNDFYYTARIALTLAGCGRKPIALSRPPTAPPIAQNDAAPEPAPNPINPLGLFEPSVPDEGQPVAAAGRKKRIILDPLLD